MYIFSYIYVKIWFQNRRTKWKKNRQHIQRRGGRAQEQRYKILGRGEQGLLQAEPQPQSKFKFLA
ncbi:hypothetical protein NQ318_006136 [Aromia moschata]|uniref:Homeobox domain-containing protein n=1 Tax=Aromia moschata TaxID=1265417 RepID=A0AAV8XMZ9_9CUCU|nr:hypothetical protein NQ318_006136 [Aromia moschata]